VFDLSNDLNNLKIKTDEEIAKIKVPVSASADGSRAARRRNKLRSLLKRNRVRNRMASRAVDDQDTDA
jgi:hypothetical protein